MTLQRQRSTVAWIAILLTLVVPVSIQAQATQATSHGSSQHLEDAQKAMRRVAYLVGDWEGEGWIMMAPGRRTTYRQTERVVFGAQNTALVMHGEGRERDSASGDWAVRFQAAAVLTYDAAERRYRMMAAGGNGRASVVAPEIRDDGFTWAFETQGMKIRYVLTHTAADGWDEIGEMSSDGGATWRQFMGMTLRRR